MPSEPRVRRGAGQTISAPLTGAVLSGSATARAYLEIKARILDNELMPGSSHLEQDLAQSLGMSRTPVREALIRLADERLVEIRPRHGVRVLPVSVEDMRDIYELLTELEALAARRAAELGLSAAEIAALEAAVAEMDGALARDDLEAWSSADTRFHDLLVAASHNKRLVAAVKLCLDQVASNDDHRAVVAAIRARDAAMAHRVHHEHRARAGKLLLELLASSDKAEF